MPLVWQLSVTHFANKTILRGVLIDEMPFRFNSKSGKLRNLVIILRSYFARSVANEEISIVINGDHIRAKTDTKGAFSISYDSVINGEINIYYGNDSTPLEIAQRYPVVFPETSGKYEVISDIDDTIMVSYTADFFKRVGTVAFISPYRRKTINYTKDLFKEFEDQQSRFFYVSKSEGNLFGMITTFIDHNGFPKGEIFLTPYLKLSQLLTSKKSKKFKEQRINAIMENSNKQFILVGDDSQLDMDTYTSLAEKHSNRISRIFIRQTKKRRSKLQLQKWNMLQSTGVRSTYFNNDEQFDKTILLS